MTPLFKVSMPPQDELMSELSRVLYSGMIGEGEEVYNFERSFSAKFGLCNVLAVSSGTAALHMALLLAGVEVGDEVITTAVTAEPTNTTITQCGAIPVFADVDPNNGCLDPDSVRQAITSKTKAICVVHYAGYAADVAALRELADDRGIWLIEDCAHALGGSLKGRPLGSFGHASIFSFQAIKHMTTVDGGVLVLQDASLIPVAREIRWFGLQKGIPRTEVNIVRQGYKYNMNNVTATIGSVQLRHIDEVILKHQANAEYLNTHLAKNTFAWPAHSIIESRGAYWLYSILSNAADRLMAGLERAGIASGKVHKLNTEHKFFSGKIRQKLVGTNDFYSKLVHVPCGWWVTRSELDRIVEVASRLKG